MLKRELKLDKFERDDDYDIPVAFGNVAVFVSAVGVASEQPSICVTTSLSADFGMKSEVYEPLNSINSFRPRFGKSSRWQRRGFGLVIARPRKQCWPKRGR